MGSAFEGPQMRAVGLVCGSVSLATKQFYAVKLHTDGTVIVCSGATDKPIGILQNAPTVGQEAEVCVIGQTKVNSDAALSVNDSIGTSADGQLAAYTASDTTKHIIGIVTQASGAAGGYAVAFVNCANSRTLA